MLKKSRLTKPGTTLAGPKAAKEAPMPPLWTTLKPCVAGEPVAGHSEGQSVHEQNVQTAAALEHGTNAVGDRGG